MRQMLDLGTPVDLLTKDELSEALAEDARQRARLATIKYRRLPILSGQAVTGKLDIGGDSRPGWSGQPIGPASGYQWEFKLLAVNGLTPGVAPDVVNLYIQGAGSSLAWWQFNGNNFAYTFGRGELVLLPNESIRLASVGTFASTATISLTGSIIQSAAERFAEVVA